MNPSLEETIYIDFVTSAPTTGAAIDADSTPTCEVFEDATDTSILSPTVTKRTGKTGNYRVPIAATAANGFEAGKSYNVVVSATVGAVAAKAVLRTFQMRLNDVDDLATPAQVNAQCDTALADAGVTTTVMGRIDAPVSTRATPGSAMSLSSDYDAAKDAASQTSVDAIAAVVAAIQAIDVKLNSTMEADGPVFRFTTNALEQAPTGTGGGGTVDNNAIADAILKRDWTAVSGEAVYSLLNACRMLRNVWNTTGGTLTVKKEDGSTTAWTRTLSTDAAAQPITGAS